MRPSTFRRLGAVLLLALFVPACIDTPTSPGTAVDADLPAWAKGPAGRNPFAKAAEIGAQASLQAIRDVSGARHHGKSKEELRAIAEASVNRVLTEHGAPAFRFSRLDGMPRGRKVLDASQLSAGQRRLLAAVMDAAEAVGPGTTPEQFDARLRSIEEQARRELRGNDHQIVLFASATASAYYRVYHPLAQRGPTLSRFPVDGGALFDHDLAGLADAVIGGMVSGAVGGAVAGWLTGGGYGVAVVGGALGGGLGGGAAYLVSWWMEAM